MKLRLSVSYWKHMCKLESFDEFNALKKEDDARDEERRTWCGEQFHSLNIDREKTTYWHRYCKVAMYCECSAVLVSYSAESSCAGRRCDGTYAAAATSSGGST